MKNFSLRLMAVLTLMLAIIEPSYAQSHKSTANEKKIKKENAEYVKYLKKHYDCKVDVRESSDGYWYYLLHKKGNIGIIDQNGRMLVPIDKDNILYLESLGEHKLIGNKMYKDIVYKIPSADSVFVVHDKNGYTLLNTDGHINAKNIKELSFIPGYYFFSPGKGIKGITHDGVRFGNHNSRWFNSAYGDKIGLMTQDGHIILSADYNRITIGSFENGLQNSYNLAYIDQKRNGITYSGAKSIEGEIPDVPCLFETVEVCADPYGQPYWKCTPKTEDFSETIVFDPNQDYTYLLRCKDKGEKLYLMGELYEAKKYYTGEGSSAPWAKFYTGCIKQCMANTLNLPAKHLTTLILEDEVYTSSDAYRYLDGTYPHPDFDAERKMLKDGANDFLEYLQIDSTFAVAAQRHYQQIMGNDGMLANLETVTIPDYNKATSVLESKRSSLLQSRYEAEQRALALEQQRLAEEEARRNQSNILEGLLIGLVAAGTQAIINNAISSSSSSKSYSSSASSAKSSSSSASSSSTSSSASSSSSGLSDKVMKDIRRLEKDIENEEKYLKNAEERYAKNHDPLDKNLIEKHKRAIEHFKQLIEDHKK